MSEEEFQEIITAIGYLQHSIMTDIDRLMELMDKIVEDRYEQRK